MKINTKLCRILGKIMVLEAILMSAPLAVSVIYREPLINLAAFIIPILLLTVIGFIMMKRSAERAPLYQKEGFALTGLVWLIMALFGALPFVINGDIPNYVDACFEIMSGFTTTGASIIDDITAISRSSLFWRSLSHWIGGMGVLVFVLIFIPESNDGSSMHLLRAESPGPQVGKLASKMKVTARILYLIYLGLTILEIGILMLDKPIPGYEKDQLFFSLLTTFGCAGTGGFGFIPGSMELFNPFSQYVIATFLFLFGCNFALYYLILIGKAKELLKSEELKSYGAIIIVSISIVFFSLLFGTGAAELNFTVEEAFRHTYFQVASIMTTAGFTTTDYNVWPSAATTTLIMVMFMGGMAGSTAGGIKLSRIVIAVKGIYISIRKLINPRYVSKTKFEGKAIGEKTVDSVYTFITLYFIILFVTVFLLSFDPVNGSTATVVSDVGEYTVTHGFTSNFTAALSCISNIGPGLEAVGPYLSFSGYGYFSKILLTLVMMMGRLEFFPVLLLFSPRTWKNN